MAADPQQAEEAYRNALPRWREILLAHPDYARDSANQEELYEIVVKYLDLVQRERGDRLKQLALLVDFLTQGACRPPLATVWLPPVYFIREMRINVVTPLDINDSTGRPLFNSLSMEQIRQRLRAPMPVLEPMEGPAGMMRPPGPAGQ